MLFTDYIKIILINLVSNAIKYSHSGGDVIISCEKIKSYDKIYIKDNGVGMNEETCKNLFKIEDSFSTPGTNNESGTGLGLILCNDFVKIHLVSIMAGTVLNIKACSPLKLPHGLTGSAAIRHLLYCRANGSQYASLEGSFVPCTPAACCLKNTPFEKWARCPFVFGLHTVSSLGCRSYIHATV